MDFLFWLKLRSTLRVEELERAHLEKVMVPFLHSPVPPTLRVDLPGKSFAICSIEVGYSIGFDGKFHSISSLRLPFSWPC